MSKKIETIYVCSKCEAQFSKWVGRCNECGTWGSVEVQNSKLKIKSLNSEMPIGKVVDFEKIEKKEMIRIKTGIEEFDRVLGGGIVPGSLILLGGEPGIGKSTLVLQLVDKIGNQKLKTCNEFVESIENQKLKIENCILYVSGEESAEQIKLRMDRLDIQSKALQFLGETDIEIICATIEKHKPQIVIIDSIQTMSFSELPSEAGSINQVRVCTVKLLEVAKKNNISIFIVGHVTKEGVVAGPKTLEHLVDTVLYLEGDQFHLFRLLRTAKNRFGSTNEVGVFEMKEKGLIEVQNPSKEFLSQRTKAETGSIVTSTMEGSRAFLIEVQALVSKTVFGYPQRRASGFDLNRLQLLATVLTRRCKCNLGNQDVYLNIAGGIKIEEPAIDLAVCLAIVSAFKNKPIDSNLVAFGEVGLGGEIRNVGQIDKRIIEAKKLGFKKIIIPQTNTKFSDQDIQIISVKNLNEAIEANFKYDKVDFQR
ncbi:DNA repair protein RadA [Candidatus Kuenenbacteria bacterium HGW-Kuenenbacteria-1]|uniref:DNA repair protein RadA n=1 Tax=Candidatus Kuenenbacteria bacterium HGW-Kuenenbacteria-1 TaxID=2013812 RepID=A0A2N1UNC4_9BACT|nr:MAG: DNA repair protein RadA [Candidatus Kuenenbacteria bacterium HGW-Kuenenbacteria-1]